MLKLLTLIALSVPPTSPDVAFERPSPFASGGAEYIVCGRIRVEVEYDNTYENGLTRLKGTASRGGKSADLGDALDPILQQSQFAAGVDFLCDSETVVRVEVFAVSKDGKDQSWVFLVDEALRTKSEPPVEIDRTKP